MAENNNNEIGIVKMEDEGKGEKRYYVDFYDMIDGWGEFGFFTERLYDDLEEAIKLCNKLNFELDQSNKNCGEHFGVIDKKFGKEIYCGMDQQYKIKLAEAFKSINKIIKIGNIKDDLSEIDWEALEKHWNKEYDDDFVKK